MNFNYETYGKWILAGEHTVLRGGEAIVFPLVSRRVKFLFKPGKEIVSCQVTGETHREAQLILPGLIDEALRRLNKSRQDLRGILEIESKLQLGAGLGASAAYCVGVSRLMVLNGWLSENEVYEFSRQLENIFHGESSGVDIAAALRSTPIIFKRNGEISEFQTRWKPKWYLSFSGQRGVTSECVKKVKSVWELNSQRAEFLDQEMRRSVKLCAESLALSQNDGFPMLVKAIEKAKGCFVNWGLCEAFLTLHMDKLYQMGASAVKPTGSGGGGFVLSLWQQDPPDDFRNSSIEII